MATTTTPSLPCAVFDHGTILQRTPATVRSTKRARSHGAPSTTLPDDALKPQERRLSCERQPRRRRRRCEEAAPTALLEIFARLPAKSVGRLRCASRSWAATLTSAPFVDLHLREANRRRQPTPKLFFTTAHPDNIWQHDEVLTKPCHGLVLIRGLPYHRHFVCNPSTGALLPLPDSRMSRRLQPGHQGAQGGAALLLLPLHPLLRGLLARRVGALESGSSAISTLARRRAR
ncbi:F-box protein DOR-like [Triticum aestivum]|uniref:F-box protein DOR-like n=1 Tax=Triticum aestivum TaxID=4565 RepID=UPI001D03514D|nr:F-box protein DOR-like [Triticum aestivum]